MCLIKTQSNKNIRALTFPCKSHKNPLFCVYGFVHVFKRCFLQTPFLACSRSSLNISRHILIKKLVSLTITTVPAEYILIGLCRWREGPHVQGAELLSWRASKEKQGGWIGEEMIICNNEEFMSSHRGYHRTCVRTMMMMMTMSTTTPITPSMIIFYKRRNKTWSINPTENI